MIYSISMKMHIYAKTCKNQQGRELPFEISKGREIPFRYVNYVKSIQKLSFRSRVNYLYLSRVAGIYIYMIINIYIYI